MLLIFEILKLLDTISRILRAVPKKIRPHKKCITYINFYPTIHFLIRKTSFKHFFKTPVWES